jgi:hypothetical protein
MSIDAPASKPGKPTKSEDLAERRQSEKVSKITEDFKSGISSKDKGYAPESSYCSKEACSCCENEGCDETGNAQTEDENRLVI